MNNNASDSAYPLITVIVAVFNGANTLQQCIDSVAKQTYFNKELIIIDGNSQDGTIEILKFNNDKINYWISEPDTGVYNAWNKGVEKAKGEWICFLGADDFFLEDDGLEKLITKLQDIPSEVRIAYTKVMLFGADDNPLFPVGERWENAKGNFMKGLCLPHQGVMHRRSLFERNGKFDESFRIGGDYEIMLRELKSAEAMFIPDIIVTAMRPGGLSSNPFSAVEAMQDIRRAQKKHGQYWPSFFWIKAMIRVYIRLILWKLIGEKRTRKFLDFSRRIKGQPAYWTRT